MWRNFHAHARGYGLQARLEVYRHNRIRTPSAAMVYRGKATAGNIMRLR